MQFSCHDSLSTISEQAVPNMLSREGHECFQPGQTSLGSAVKDLAISQASQAVAAIYPEDYRMIRAAAQHPDSISGASSKAHMGQAKNSCNSQAQTESDALKSELHWPSWKQLCKHGMLCSCKAISREHWPTGSLHVHWAWP